MYLITLFVEILGKKIPFVKSQQTEKVTFPNPTALPSIERVHVKNQTVHGTTHVSGAKGTIQSFSAKKTAFPLKIGVINNLQQKSQVCDINVPLFIHLLKGYNETKSRFLYLGLMFGFKLHYKGQCISKYSQNHKSAEDRPHEVLSKLHKEIQKGHIAGPFCQPPFSPFIISPIGLVPKKDSGKFRMIHDLSYPKHEDTSVNANIPRGFCAVKYEDLDTVIELIVKQGRGCYVGKVDIESAFRIIPIHPSDYWLLGLSFQGQIYYDKRLPMGASISCSTFEELSKAIQWILRNGLAKRSDWSHILDDFIAVARCKSGCRDSLERLIALCEQLGIPVNHDKTVWPNTTVEVHGVEVDTCLMIARLPEGKLEKARSLIHSLIWVKRTQLKRLQEAVGFLNFACKVVRPGRTFLRRLYDKCSIASAPHHYVRIDQEVRKDLRAWLHFLTEHNGVSLLLKEEWLSSSNLMIQSDASDLGYAAVFGNDWFFGEFSSEEKCLNITVRELYPIAISIAIWPHLFHNKFVLFLCDNEAVVHIINKQTSKDKTVMSVLRFFVINCMKNNVLFRAKHVPGRENVLADYLSRLQVERAQEQYPNINHNPCNVPRAWALYQILQDF